jgi:hypothetical protein
MLAGIRVANIGKEDEAGTVLSADQIQAGLPMTTTPERRKIEA